MVSSIEGNLELDEQSNIKLSFRISKQVIQISLENVLNP